MIAILIMPSNLAIQGLLKKLYFEKKNGYDVIISIQNDANKFLLGDPHLLYMWSRSQILVTLLFP